ncbi:MAG TPA: carboxypeptidase-like regulatory domain-containing protein [Kofleriaceae bacterium]
MRWLATLALAACAAPKTAATPADDPEVGRVEGIVTDRTGKPVAGADIYFGSDSESHPTDDSGHYSTLLRAGANRARLVYAPPYGDSDATWMTATPFEVAAYKLTRHDFAFAPENCRLPRDDDDTDRVFELALVETFGNLHRRVRVVDYRRRSSGNSVSMGGVDLTTIALLQDESDRSHKMIDYSHIDAEILSGCASRVTIGRSCVAPHESAIDCDEGTYWLYVKDASGWHRLASVGGYAT